MTTPANLRLSNLPGKATWGGYVYVLAFDNDTVKVGSTGNPRERIRFHQTSAAQFNIAMVAHWVSQEIKIYLRAEKRLMSIASGMSTGSSLREWFRGVDFDALVEIAEAVTSSNPDAALPHTRIIQTAADAAPVGLWCRIKGALDVETNAEAANHCGIPLRTLERMIANPGSSLFGNAMKVQAATGISLDEINAILFAHHGSEAA